MKASPGTRTAMDYSRPVPRQHKSSKEILLIAKVNLQKTACPLSACLN